MINEAINAEILAEVQESVVQLANYNGEVKTFLNNSGDTLSDLKIALILEKYERIRETKGKKLSVCPIPIK